MVCVRTLRYILTFFFFFFFKPILKAGIIRYSSTAFQQHFTLLHQQTVCISVFEKALASEFTCKYK